MSAIHDRGLRAVARVRGVREQDSRLGWQRAVTEQEQAAATTARLEERLAATPRVDGSTGMFLAHQAGMAALAADVAAARAAEASAARLSESARQHWQRDAVRLAAVEQLLEQRAVRRRAERARQETAAVEDVVTARWTHARRLASGTGGAS